VSGYWWDHMTHALSSSLVAAEMAGSGSVLTECGAEDTLLDRRGRPGGESPRSVAPAGVTAVRYIRKRETCRESR